MTVLASAIIARARSQLIDQGANGAPQRWSDADLMAWLSDGQRTIVAALPRASSKIVVIDLVAGSRQSIPTDGHCFLKAYRNMGADNATPGQAVTHTPREVLDEQYPTWHSDTATDKVVAVAFDMTDQQAFYVFPQNTGLGSLEVNYSQLPPEILTTGDALAVKDIYSTALFDYVMYRAHQKDSDYAAGQTVAQLYMASFAAFLTGNHQDAFTNITQQGKT